MTQRTLQLTQHGRSLVIWFIALNSLYTFFSTFEKALAKNWNDEYVHKEKYLKATYFFSEPPINIFEVDNK